MIDLKSKIEKINFEIKALKEFRKVTNEKINEMIEKIGELRTSIFEIEKKFNELEAKSGRAIDLYEKLKPESILAEIERQNAKLETFKELF